jgi:hypothetical protein
MLLKDSPNLWPWTLPKNHRNDPVIVLWLDQAGQPIDCHIAATTDVYPRTVRILQVFTLIACSIVDFTFENPKSSTTTEATIPGPSSARTCDSNDLAGTLDSSIDIPAKDAQKWDSRQQPDIELRGRLENKCNPSIIDGKLRNRTHSEGEASAQPTSNEAFRQIRQYSFQMGLGRVKTFLFPETGNLAT